MYFPICPSNTHLSNSHRLLFLWSITLTPRELFVALSPLWCKQIELFPSWAGKGEDNTTTGQKHVQSMLFRSTLHFTAFFMYTVWSTKLTCNSDGAQMNTQKQKNMPLGLLAKKVIKASHFIQDHCGSTRDVFHYLNPRTTFSFPTPPCLTQTPTPKPLVWIVHTFPSYTSSQLSWLLTAREAELGWGGLSSASPHLTSVTCQQHLG